MGRSEAKSVLYFNMRKTLADRGRLTDSRNMLSFALFWRYWQNVAVRLGRMPVEDEALNDSVNGGY